MATDTERGFTVIEVVLFLAITGGLFAALMLGVNSGITQQRYLDSVRSYKSLLQNQYSEVLNTRNDNVDKKCGLANDGTIDDTGPELTKGTSKCVILGRAIRITDGGTNVTTSSVTGYDLTAQDSSRLNASDDIDALNLYKFRIASFDEQTTAIDWGAYLTPLPPSTSNPESTAVILIVRSPATGLIRILTSPKPLTQDSDLSNALSIGDLSATSKLENCVKGDSGLLPKQSVVIDPTISSPDAVTTSDANGGDCR